MPEEPSAAVTRLRLFIYVFTKFILTGISSHVRPSSIRPALLHAAPLLEEKWDFGSQALISNIRDPFLHN